MENNQLHEFAKRIILAQKLPELEKSKEIAAVTKEAKNFNISPNRILSYAMANADQLKHETEKRATDVKTLTGYTEWYKKNVSENVNTAQFHQHLNDHVRQTTNFQFYD